jgi:peptide deformylase
MILEIKTYGHPILRQRGAVIEEITPEIKQLGQDMLETMYAAKGVGLAAQQIGRALQLAVIDVREVTDRPSSANIEGTPVNLQEFMPLILINPQIKPLGDLVEGDEGCLSFPEICAEIIRPKLIEVTYLNSDGQKASFTCDGLLSRAIQHEVDHLKGILFIDRMRQADRKRQQMELDDLHATTQTTLAETS